MPSLLDPTFSYFPKSQNVSWLFVLMKNEINWQPYNKSECVLLTDMKRVKKETEFEFILLRLSRQSFKMKCTSQKPYSELIKPVSNVSTLILNLCD